MRMSFIKKFFACFFVMFIYLFFNMDAFASEKPLIIVVHGFGGGNRPQGWSDEFTNKWNVGDVKEITFRYPGRDDNSATSFLDFSRHAGDWAMAVRKQIKYFVDQNPDRPIIIVAHSWGSVATAMALNGGTGYGAGTELENPINLGDRRIQELITLGSPLGRTHAAIPGNLNQFGIDVSETKPSMVDHWANIYDINDPISNQSHHLAGADENIEVKHSASSSPIINWIKDLFTGGISSHRNIWTNPEVIKYIQNTEKRLEETSKPVPNPSQPPKISPPSPPPIPSPSATTPPPLPSVPVKKPTPTPPITNTTKNIDFTVVAMDEHKTAVDKARIDVSGAASGTQFISNGMAKFTGFPEGIYNIEASAADYDTNNISARIDASTPIITITLRREPNPNGTVDFGVFVADKHGSAVPNVNIELAGPAASKVFAPGGMAIFHAVREGTYSIKLSAPGYVTEVMPLTVAPDMGGEVGGVTGVSILLDKQATPSTSPAATPASNPDTLVGNWQGEAIITKDSYDAKNIGKTTPITAKFIAQGNGYQFYINGKRIDNDNSYKVQIDNMNRQVSFSKSEHNLDTAMSLVVIGDTIQGQGSYLMSIRDKNDMSHTYERVVKITMKRTH